MFPPKPLAAGASIHLLSIELSIYLPVYLSSVRLFQRGRLEALSLLLERGGNLESRTGTDGTPLVWGCMGGDVQVVRYLLKRGANISAITKV